MLRGGSRQGPGTGSEFLKIGKDNRNLIEYRVGVFSGEPSNTAETNNRKDVVASLALRPVSFLKVHGSVYFGEGTAKADSPYGTFKAGETRLLRRGHRKGGQPLRDIQGRGDIPQGQVERRSGNGGWTDVSQERIHGRSRRIRQEPGRLRHPRGLRHSFSRHRGICGLSGPEYRPERLAVQLHLWTGISP